MSESIVALVIIGLILTVALTLTLTLVQTLRGVVTVASFVMLALDF
jgi:hypothetical protein